MTIDLVYLVNFLKTSEKKPKKTWENPCELNTQAR